MNQPGGQTRTRFQSRHALITSDGQVASVVPGLEGVRYIAHITPAMGAGFAQSTLVFEAVARAALTSPNESVLYLQEGQAELSLGGEVHSLRAGSYAYVPPFVEAEVRTAGSSATLVQFQKKFVPLENVAPPTQRVGHANEIQGQPFLGNKRALLQVLLPDEIAFDLAVNIFTYEPGAMLPFVETHVMEHGLLMLSGQGIYRLEDAWYPVTAGDVIWMAPFCPQWFAALGDVPASYLYYKDVNRALLSP